MADRSFIAPESNPETQPFWNAASEGRLLVGLCRETCRAFFPPRALSPFTFGPTELIDSGGGGEIYTFTRVAKSPNGPYAVGYVELDAGPRLLTSFVGCDPAALAIGSRVRVVFTPTDGGPPAITFTLAEGAAQATPDQPFAAAQPPTR